MKLLVLDSNYSPEMNQLFHSLGRDNVTLYTTDKERFEKFHSYDRIKEFNQEEFDLDQIQADAVYAYNTSEMENVRCKIPYFFSIHAGTWPNEFNYKYFQQKHSHIKGASAVFTNDSKLNKFAHWFGFNSYFVNKPVDTFKYRPGIANRKFITPKLHIGFIPSESDTHRNKIVENMWLSAKSNWILHVPQESNLKVSKNVIKHKTELEYGIYYKEIYQDTHIMINPEDLYKDKGYHYDLINDAMGTGNVAVMPNQHGSNSHVMFDKFHYFKMDFIDSNTLLNILRYADKRREKLARMSEASSDLIEKYFGKGNVVEEKIRIIQENI